MSPTVERKKIHPTRLIKEEEKSGQLQKVELLPDGVGTITLDVKGVLKGGEVPPLNKVYMRIDDVAHLTLSPLRLGPSEEGIRSDVTIENGKNNKGQGCDQKTASLYSSITHIDPLKHMNLDQKQQ